MPRRVVRPGHCIGLPRALYGPAIFVAMSWAAAFAALLTGELSAAAAHGERALELLSEEHLPVRWVLGTHIPVLIESGREAEARQLMDGYAAPPREHKDVIGVVTQAARGLSRLAAGELVPGVANLVAADARMRSEEHTSELQSLRHL